MLSVVVEYYAWIVALLSVYFLVFALTNAFWLWIYSKKPRIFQGPKVSVCIPARNEEKNIESCIRSFMAQSYENYEVLVLNDNSEDGTAGILSSLALEFPGKLRVFDGKPLEEGWTGKIFAMNQLIQYADGEYLLFSDADTIHGRDSIAFAVTNLTVHNADMLSGYIKERVVTFGERITIPLMFMLTGFVLPMFLNRITPFSFTSVAIGQYIMIKRRAFEDVGGYETMKNLISEDVFLARLPEIVEASPRKIFLMAGGNDLSGNRPVEEVVANVRKMLEMIREQAPACEIYLQSVITPNNEVLAYAYIKNKQHLMRQLNEQYKALCDEGLATWVDLRPILENEQGELREELTKDGIHFHPEAYILWTNYLKKMKYLRK